jgi:hypothetical protein
VELQELRVDWKPGSENLADYFTKTHPVHHHIEQRHVYVKDPPRQKQPTIPSRLRQEIKEIYIQEAANCNEGLHEGPSLNFTATLSLFNKYSTATLLIEVAASTVWRRGGWCQTDTCKTK